MTTPLPDRRPGKKVCSFRWIPGVKKTRQARHKPGSVFPLAGTAIIPLGVMLPSPSSDLPGNIGRASLKRSPIWSCSCRGLPSRQSCLCRWWALTPPFHPYPSTSSGRFVFCGAFPRLPALAVSQRLAHGARTFLALQLAQGATACLAWRLSHSITFLGLQARPGSKLIFPGSCVKYLADEVVHGKCSRPHQHPGQPERRQ